MAGSTRASRGARGVQSRPSLSSPARRVVSFLSALDHFATPSRNPGKNCQLRQYLLSAKIHEHKYNIPRRRRTSVRRRGPVSKPGPTRVRSLTIRLNHNPPALCRRVRRFPAPTVRPLTDESIPPLRATRLRSRPPPRIRAKVNRNTLKGVSLCATSGRLPGLRPPQTSPPSRPTHRWSGKFVFGRP